MQSSACSSCECCRSLSCCKPLGYTSMTNSCRFRNWTSKFPQAIPARRKPAADSSHALTAAFYRVWDELSNMSSSKQAARPSSTNLPSSLRTSEPSRRLVGWPLFRGGDRSSVDDSAGQPGWAISCFPGSRSPAACPSLLVAWAMKRIEMTPVQRVAMQGCRTASGSGPSSCLTAIQRPAPGG